MRCVRTLAVSLVIVLFIALGGLAQSTPEAIRIGVQLPLSGERAPVGRMIQQAVDLAVGDANKDGGVRGVPLAAIYEDSGTSADGAVAALRRLIQTHRVVAVVGELFSPFAMASREVVEQANVPYVIGGTNPRTTENARWVFRVAASDALLADLMARYAVEQLKPRRLAVLSSRVGIHNARADLVASVLRDRYGVAPAVRDTWKPDDRDFTAQLEKVKAAGVDTIIALGETGEAPAFLRQAKALGGNVRILAHRDFGAPTALAEAGDAAEGALIVTEYVPALLDPERRAWAERFHQRYGVDPNIINAQHYDAVWLLLAAMRATGTTGPEIRTGLEQLRGARGVMADYTFDATRNGVHRFYVARVTAGQPRLEAVLDESR
jgi:branched-chain amino acid transport system substrate-binding protein